MKRITTHSVLVAAMCTVIVACEKNDLPLNDEPLSPVFENNNGMTVLGQKLENPYSVENMEKAYLNLKSSGYETPGVQIETTHLYLRFLPQNYDELSLLKSDSTIILYEIPMDYEITEPGVYYHDPSLPDTAITWQYCAVEVDKHLPNVQYELLAKLYIPLETESADTKSSNSLSSFFERLEDEALRITGNLDRTINTRGNSKWRPAGRIRVWDNIISGYAPVEGVEVKARRWFTTHKGTTNSQGYYSCDGTFKRDANYSIDWDRHNFSIRSGSVGQASYDGPKRDGNWDVDIKGGKSQYYAQIFRAAHHYYYKNIDGLRRPPENKFLRPQMKIAAYYEESGTNGNCAAWRRTLGILSWIKIWNPQHSSQEIYGTVIHELAHASHWDMGHGDFNDTETIVVESWARGVQWYLTKMVYPGYPGGSTSRGKYTQVVVDMLDSPSDVNNGSELLAQDNVSGYTIRQIEDALNEQAKWDAWKTNIKNRYNNETENNLDALFSYWSN